MDYEERVERLREQGVLSRDQARRLAGSLGEVSREGAAEHRSRRVSVLWALLLILSLPALFVAGGLVPEATQVQDVRTGLNQLQEIGDMGRPLAGGLSLALFIGIPLVALLIWITALYNGLVNREERVLETWAQVESNYQRRADLIPNLLETVAKYLRFEQETLTRVVGGRSAAMGGRETFDEADEARFRGAVDEIGKARETSAAVLKDIQGAPVDDAQLQRLQAAQQVLGASLHRILALSENYPVLRSADQMLTLQAELEGTENRINVARMRFNEAAAGFNAAVRRMPTSLVASLGGFRRKAYFQSNAGADQAVRVRFQR